MNKIIKNKNKQRKLNKVTGNTRKKEHNGKQSKLEEHTGKVKEK